MDDLNPTPDLDVSQLSAPDLQRLGVTVAQVRAVYARPAVVIEPDPTSQYPDMWQLLGLTNNGRFIFVALAYDDSTGKFAAFGIEIALDLAALRFLLCRDAA